MLRSVSVMSWGWLLHVQGCESQLLEAHLATAEMLEKLGTRGHHSGFTETGDTFTLKRCSDALLELTLYLHPEPQCGEPDEESTRSTRWWRQNGPDIEREVAQALARMREADPRP
ncbi:MAG TPA: hypothetical protein VME21_07120 [Steroidobacteraceae bacterium]|nr:hypothetical protein [Steroidobacteraceae bacterium]